MRNLVAFIVTMFASGICASAGIDLSSYKNNEFSITALIPKGGTLCITSTAEHDHGPLISLGGAGTDCGENPDGRFIELFASYSATGQLVSLTKFLKSQCIDVGGGVCKSPHEKFSIAGKESSSGLVQHTNGVEDIFVVTQAMIGTNVVTYVCRLHSSKANQKADIVPFMAFLKSLRLP